MSRHRQDRGARDFWPNSWPSPRAEIVAGRVARYAWSAPSAIVHRLPERSCGLVPPGINRWHVQLSVTAATETRLSGTVGSRHALNSANAWRFAPQPQPKGKP